MGENFSMTELFVKNWYFDSSETMNIMLVSLFKKKNQPSVLGGFVG